MFIQQGLLLGLQLYYFLDDYNNFYRLLDKYEVLWKLPETYYLMALIQKNCDNLEKSRDCVKEYQKLRDITVLSNFPKDLQMDNKVRELEKYLYKQEEFRMKIYLNGKEFEIGDGDDLEAVTYRWVNGKYVATIWLRWWEN